MSASTPIVGPPVVGIDFGTTNSAGAVLQPDGAGRTVQAPGLEAFRTVLCFWTECRALRHAAGPGAVAAYLEDARLIMSMKTYLAQHSFSNTQIMDRPFTLETSVALFLRGPLADQGLAGQDMASARIVAGRPVRFAGELAEDALGETRLRESFRQAGLGEVDVAYEPEAACFRFTRALQAPVTVLIGDFGGGTSASNVVARPSWHSLNTLPTDCPKIRQHMTGQVGTMWSAA